MTPGTIIVTGESVVDLIPAGPEGRHEYRAVTGGSSFNVALGLARLGMPVAFCDTLSRDPEGQRMFAKLADAGADMALVRRSDLPSTAALVAMDAEGKPHFSLYVAGSTTDADPPLNDLASDWPAQACHLHGGSFASTIGKGGDAFLAASLALKGKATVSYDINIRPLIIPPRETSRWLVEERVLAASIVKASDDDLKWLYPGYLPEQVAHRWSEYRARLVALTLGSGGAMIFGAGAPVRITPQPVKIVDTLGAGDSFMAALLAAAAADGALGDAERLLDPARAARWLSIAVLASGITCARAGSDPPTRAEVRLASIAGGLKLEAG